MLEEVAQSDLGDGGLQLLGGLVAEHREAALLLPGLRLSPDQLLTDLTGLLLHVVALGDQVLLHQLLLGFVRAQHLPHEDDRLLEEGGESFRGTLSN